MSQQIKQARTPGSNRVGTNMFGKGQRVISDAYRAGWEHAFGTGKKQKVIRSKTKRKG